MSTSWKYRAGILVRNVPVRIKSGPNAGRRWSLASSGSGYGSGRNEAARMEVIAALVRPDDCFWDIGAHCGYVTLLAAQRTRSRVYACEPSRINRWYLHRHIAWNRIDNVQVLPYAISQQDGQSSFGGGNSSRGFRLGGGDEIVTVRSLASLIEQDGCTPPTYLKIDAEFAEADILAGAGVYLRTSNLLIVLGTHSAEIHERCVGILRENGLHLVAAGNVARARATGWSGALTETDVLAYGSARDVPKNVVEAFRRL